MATGYHRTTLSEGRCTIIKILEGIYTTILEDRDTMVLVIESERSRTRKLWGSLGVNIPR